MRVLVTWGSERGGTEGIGRMIGEALESAGVDVTMAPADQIEHLDGYGAVIVGGGLYANRWHRSARRFVRRHLAALRRVPVWFFSSGPLDESADRAELPPCGQVAVLMARVGARAHVTFGGRLAADAKGFPASAMARTTAGDWRNPARIRTWATELAATLPSAHPGVATEPPARSLPRWFAHGVTGWAIAAAALALLLRTTSAGAAMWLHALLLPVVFAAVGWLYFRRRGARDPLPTALGFALLTAGLDLTVFAGLVWRSPALLGSLPGLWLPLVLVFAVTWTAGAVASTLPWPKPGAAPPSASRAPAPSHAAGRSR